MARRRAAFVDRPFGDEEHRVDLRQPALFVPRAVDLGAPHRVDRAFDRGLRRPLFSDRVGRDRDRDFAHRRSPQRPDPRARDVAGALGVELAGLAGADEHDTRLTVEGVHTVQPARAVLGLHDPQGRGPRRAREPRWRIGVRKEGDHDGVDLADLGGPGRTELHGLTFFRTVRVAMRSRACSGGTTRIRSSPWRRVSP